MHPVVNAAVLEHNERVTRAELDNNDVALVYPIGPFYEGYNRLFNTLLIASANDDSGIYISQKLHCLQGQLKLIHSFCTRDTWNVLTLSLASIESYQKFEEDF